MFSFLKCACDFSVWRELLKSSSCSTKIFVAAVVALRLKNPLLRENVNMLLCYMFFSDVPVSHVIKEQIVDVAVPHFLM